MKLESFLKYMFQVLILAGIFGWLKILGIFDIEAFINTLRF